MGIRWRGLPAWFLARSYHLAMLPGLKRKARLLIDWNVQLLVGRDASALGQLGHPPSVADSGRPRGAPSAGNGHGASGDVARPAATDAAGDR